MENAKKRVEIVLVHLKFHLIVRLIFDIDELHENE